MWKNLKWAIICYYWKLQILSPVSIKKNHYWEREENIFKKSNWQKQEKITVTQDVKYWYFLFCPPMSDMGDFLSAPHPTPISCQALHLFHAPNQIVFLPDFQRALQRHNTEHSKQIFPEKEFRGLSLNFHIHVSVNDLYIPTNSLPILLQENMWTDPGNI